MKKLILFLSILLTLTAFSGNAFARGGSFGGGRAGGFSSGGFRGSSSFSSGRSSSFGGYRSSGAPATISRPAVRTPGSYSYMTGGHTTVINNGGGYHYGYGGGGFWNGYFLGSMMNQPVYGPGGVVVAPASCNWGWIVINTLVGLLILFFVIVFLGALWEAIREL